MASLKEIKGRIASVQSTQKITSAMRMVASAKLHRTQQMTQNFLVYIEELQKTLSALKGTSPIKGEEAAQSMHIDLNSPSYGGAGRGYVCLIPISSGSGLCGAFNSNIAKATKTAIAEYKSKGIDVCILPVGKKIAHDLKHEGIDCNLDFNLIAENVGKGDAFTPCRQLVEYLQGQLSLGKIDGVEFIYHHFHSMGKQIVTREPLDMIPPVYNPEASSSLTGRAGVGLYITEPSPSELLTELHPKMLNSKVYGIILDSVTSEHAARMLAMQTADDNAKELLQELTLLYNKSRQQAITNELIDIMGGKVSSN